MVVLARSACLLLICYITYRHKFGTTSVAFIENMTPEEREKEVLYYSVPFLCSASTETHLVAFCRQDFASL